MNKIVSLLNQLALIVLKFRREKKVAVNIGYILIRSSTGRENEVIERLSDYKNITEKHIIYGEWDIIARVEFEKLPELNSLVLEIRGISGVSQTSTLVVF